jgi:hypothetical protein
LREPLEPHAYGRWVLMMDAISVGTLGTAALAGFWCLAEGLNDGAVGTELPCGLAAVLAFGGTLGLVIAPMFVHGSFGRWDKGGWSVALRLGLPVAALLALHWEPELAYPAVPIAFIVAMVIDAVFLARTQARPPPDRQRVSVEATGTGMSLRVSF